MKYKLPIKAEKPDSNLVKSVMYRIPADILYLFNESLSKSNLSAQQLLDSMVRHCLRNLDKESDNK